MSKTLYTAMIEAEDGLHLFRKNISDHNAQYEDFEIAMEDKADDLDGELLTIYAPGDIVEDVTLEDPKYKIKPEFLHLWGEDATEDTVITGDDVESIARGWDKTVADVIDQLIQIN